VPALAVPVGSDLEIDAEREQSCLRLWTADSRAHAGGLPVGSDQKSRWYQTTCLVDQLTELVLYVHDDAAVRVRS